VHLVHGVARSQSVLDISPSFFVFLEVLVRTVVLLVTRLHKQNLGGTYSGPYYRAATRGHD
jgi:hypothetical protein